jgi:ABC-type transporter MlaC component
MSKIKFFLEKKNLGKSYVLELSDEEITKKPITYYIELIRNKGYKSVMKALRNMRYKYKKSKPPNPKLIAKINLIISQINKEPNVRGVLK